jgi:hypothetical protein
MYSNEVNALAGAVDALAKALRGEPFNAALLMPGMFQGASPATGGGPGYPLVSFLPRAKKDTAPIPCAS